MCVTAELLSHVQFFVIPWTIDLRAPLSMGFFQARILEWVAISSSKKSSKPRYWTHTSCVPYIWGKFFTTAPPKKPVHNNTQSKFSLVVFVFLKFPCHWRNYNMMVPSNGFRTSSWRDHDLSVLVFGQKQYYLSKSNCTIFIKTAPLQTGGV